MFELTLQGQAAAGVRWTSLSSGCNAVSEILRAVVLARLLSPVDFGLMAMVAVVIGFAQMFVDLGVSAAIIHRQDATKEQLSSLYWLNIVVGILAFGVVWICLPLVSMLFREPRIVPLLRLAALVFLIAPIGSQFEILLQKELEFRLLARWEIAASVTSTIVAVACGAAGFGVWAMVYCFLTSCTVKAVLLARIGFTRFRPSFHFRRSDLKGYIGFGLYQMGQRGLNYLAERLDQLLIGPLLGAHTLGFYNFALNLTAQPISRINPILTKVAFPLFSKVQHDTARLKRGYLKLVHLIVTVNAPLLIGLAAVAPWAVPIIFGAKWGPSIRLIQILSFVALSRAIGNPSGSLQLAKGRADLGFWWDLILLASSVPAIYAGGRIAGATGVALALLLVQLSLSVPMYLFMIRPLIGGCAIQYLRATLQPVGVAMVMGGIILYLPTLQSSLPQGATLATQVVVGALVYILLLQALYGSTVAEFRAIILSR